MTLLTNLLKTVLNGSAALLATFGAGAKSSIVQADSAAEREEASAPTPPSALPTEDSDEAAKADLVGWETVDVDTISVHGGVVTEDWELLSAGSGGQDSSQDSDEWTTVEDR